MTLWYVAELNNDQIKEYDAKIVSNAFELRSSAIKYLHKIRELEGGSYILITRDDDL